MPTKLFFDGFLFCANLPPMKRAFSIVIILSMTLHCASRLGIISYLYSQRHEIAYSVGLIAEVPMTMCNDEFHRIGGVLVLLQSRTADDRVPIVLSAAQEITLFAHVEYLQLSSPTGTLTEHNTSTILNAYSKRLSAIFHPPC